MSANFLLGKEPARAEALDIQMVSVSCSLVKTAELQATCRSIFKKSYDSSNTASYSPAAICFVRSSPIEKKILQRYRVSAIPPIATIPARRQNYNVFGNLNFLIIPIAL